MINPLLKFWLRNENAAVPLGDHLVAPTSGEILSIDSVETAGKITKTPWGEIKYTLPKGEFILIRIFLSLWDGHFTKSPYTGTITNIDYQPGKFLPAFTPRALIENEHQLFTLLTRFGAVFVMQIAGILARRTISLTHTNQPVQTGQNIGYILFGSQVALFIPRKAIGAIRVKVGEKILAGETILCSVK
jgi:phosphatidylserine decarboxylase